MVAAGVKHNLLSNALVRLLFCGLLILLARFAYVVTLTGESCALGSFCFFSFPENYTLVVAGTTSAASAVVDDRTVVSPSDLRTSKEWINSVLFYSSVFQDLVSEGYLSPKSKALCVQTVAGQEVAALKEIGVEDAIGISTKAAKPLVFKGEGTRIPFDDDTFDFVFSGGAGLQNSSRPADFASEMARTVKPEGFLVVHATAKDTYSLDSFLGLFNSCTLVKLRDIDGLDSPIREFVMKKQVGIVRSSLVIMNPNGIGSFKNECSVPAHKHELVRNAEPLIKEEPLKPWITLKKNIKNIKYLPSMVDISFKNRYIYVDVGSRSYGSSIGSWFKKQYPKQNKTFHVYAIEADKTFHDQYSKKKGVTLLPYAAWVKNETLSFEINGDPGQEEGVSKGKGRGMGRIQPVKSDGGGGGRIAREVDMIQGFDFADWLKSSVSDKDFVVMKMDVEGAEFELIPRLLDTGAICLIDEIFLECHYNRWQRCCPGERSAKYDRTYDQCLELFTSLRERGVLVHQWW